MRRIRDARGPRGLGACGALAALALGAGCASSSLPSMATEGPDHSPAGGNRATSDEIRELFTDWNAALSSGDPAVVADRYAPGAVLLPTVSDRVRDTPELIEDYFHHFLAYSPVGEIERSVIRVLGDATAKDVGVYTFTLTEEDGTLKIVRARYTFVYERIGGEWLIAHHHSSHMPESY